eukprot:CAMPEP_0114567408 /NCGR_PEP_ID=MMETSP0114-20121206/15462_1 /TAXON_ID=31324 /ORGANISM="Goniomonas sp, Strain m" /LENGTH=206 /DNA_ID=CAMNT_0001753989 /DNA_START=228 /DNA_END=848 /DNA_ORIENTATION=+
MVWVIAPSGYYEGVFSRYVHFLPEMTARGDPVRYQADGNATGQLAALLRTGTSQLRAVEDDRTRLQGLPITLMGFSKGGVVLNQLLSELSPSRSLDLQDPFPLMRRVQAIHWLDVGLNHPGAYLTDDDTLSAVARLRQPGGTGPPTLLFHGTPRQWKDSFRPHIREQCVKLLGELGVPVGMVWYFADQEPSLEAHFRVLEEFETGG